MHFNRGVVAGSFFYICTECTSGFQIGKIQWSLFLSSLSKSRLVMILLHDFCCYCWCCCCLSSFAIFLFSCLISCLTRWSDRMKR